MEINPYQIRLPSDLDSATRKVFTELLTVLRSQHSKAQAGDTTYFWNLAEGTSNRQLFNLGAKTKFFHPKYGIIIGMYVKFSEWDLAAGPVCPVGLLATESELEYVVTNDLSKSDSSLFVGISILGEAPGEADYGWVIIEGANPKTINASILPQDRFQDYIWSSSGQLSPAGVGTSVGRRLAFDSDPSLGPGEFYIKAGGPSFDLIRSLTQDQLDSHEEVINSHASWIITANANFASLFSSVSSADSLISTLETRLGLEESTRSGAVDFLQLQINAITGFDGATHVTSVEFQNYMSMCATETNSIAAQVSYLTAQVSSLNLSTLASSVDSLSLTFTSFATSVATIMPTHLAATDPHPQYVKTASNSNYYDGWVEGVFSSANTQVGPFAGTAVASGTIGTTAPTALVDGKHWAGILLRSAASANSGYRFITIENLATGALELYHRSVVALVGVNATRVVRLGYHDSITNADAVDGVYFEINGAVAVGKSSSNSVRTSAATTVTLDVDTYYVFEITINGAATSATFTITEEDTGVVVYSEVVNTNIPSAARPFRSSVVTHSTGAVVTDLIWLVKMGHGTKAGWQRHGT